MSKQTPVRSQYLQIKRQYPQAIVFFRLGDFYETFDGDAEITSRELDLVLTQRQGAPMAGVPFHAAETYISQLVSKGYHVAICEQLGSETVKGLVPRDVVRVVTPGTIIEPEMLAQKRNNYLVAISAGEEFHRFGLAYADISTGEFATTQIGKALQGGSGETNAFAQLQDELDRLAPAEVVVPASAVDNPAWKKLLDSKYSVSTLPDWQFDTGNARNVLLAQFQTSTLAGFGCEGLPEAVRAAGAALQYLQQVQKGLVGQLKGLSTYHVANYMLLDAATRRNLELTESIRSGARQGSLLNVLDKTVTPMGGRMLRRWLNQPLLDIQELDQRLDHVEILFRDGIFRAELRSLLRPLADLERLANRIMSGSARPRDLVGIRSALQAAAPIRACIESVKDKDRNPLPSPTPMPEILDLLTRAITDDPPPMMTKPGVIRPGFSTELDGVQAGASDARNWIANLEKTERQRTGIKNLKVGFNKVFGYYIELTKSQQHLAPDNYIRKQTLVNAERYITPELKEYESLVLSAGERQLDIERRLFTQICEQISVSGRGLIQMAVIFAHLDVVAGLAEVAALSGYVRPVLVEDNTLVIQGGRHPVVEKMLDETRFVPNDVAFEDGARIHIITGPNMSGKSVFLRQIALIVLMAQVGSFVPAESARIGLVDRIFTRVGAQDEVYAGQSTFMVEMVETANILNNATVNSLVVLDEIGRGTSTYDGLSIAWAVVEYLHNHPGLKCKTLFATHYHELTDLSELLPGVTNFNVAVAEQGDTVAFLHRIIPGGADRSYGIHVAQLAGLPPSVTKRAAELLRELEIRAPQAVRRPSHLRAQQQMALFPEVSPLLKELSDLDVTNMTPLDAINKLYEWKRRFSI